MKQESGDPAGTTELSLYIDGGDVVIAGPTQAALEYVDQLRTAGARVTSPVTVGRGAADVVAAASTAGVLAQVAQGGVYLRVASESVPHLISEGLMPTRDGVHTFLGMTRAGGQISHHLRFTGMTVSPVELVNFQALAIGLALRMAIAETSELIARVEGKVDALLALAHAEWTGNVLGLHQTLSDYCDVLDESGVVTTSDWNSISSTGPQLAIMVNRLRRHVVESLVELSPEDGVGDRADAMSNLLDSARIDETLSLLVIVEDALFKFQRLRVAHVMRTEPEFLEATVDSARRILAEYAKLDEELFQSATRLVDAASEVKPLEIHRILAVSSLAKSSGRLKVVLDTFADSRRLQGAEWADSDLPQVRDAVAEMRRRAQLAGGEVKALGSRAVDRGYSRIDAVGRAMQAAAQRRLDSSGADESAQVESD